MHKNILFSLIVAKIKLCRSSKKKTKRRCSKLSAMEILANEYSQKAEFKKEELNVRRMELEFAKEKYAAETEERRARVELEIEERRTLLSLLKDRC